MTDGYGENQRTAWFLIHGPFAGRNIANSRPQRIFAATVANRFNFYGYPGLPSGRYYSGIFNTWTFCPAKNRKFPTSNPIFPLEFPSNLNIINITSRNGLLAIQGPKALNILQKLTNFNLNDIKYYSFKYIDIMDIKNVLVSATGYTGAGGFEIYTDKDNIRKIWDYLFSLNNVDLSPIGLGARDTLRMEMGYCLYGNEINETTTPLEAGLSWIVDFSKDFIGRDALKK